MFACASGVAGDLIECRLNLVNTNRFTSPLAVAQTDQTVADRLDLERTPARLLPDLLDGGIVIAQFASQQGRE